MIMFLLERRPKRRKRVIKEKGALQVYDRDCSVPL